MKFGGWGWALGKIMQYNKENTKTGQKYNFNVSYPTDGRRAGSRPQWLSEEFYGDTADDAADGSWVFVRPNL